MEIRAATIGDFEGASAVQHAVIPANHPYEYANNILASGTINFVAVHENLIVGFISILIGGLNPNGPHLWQRLRPYLAFVGVSPELQGKHVGTELIRAAWRAIVPNIANGVWLECAESEAAFYEKLGFIRAAPAFVRTHAGMDPKGPVYYLNSD